VDRAHQRELLVHGAVTLVGRIVDSSNQALLVEVALEGQTARACYKAEAGERPLWDFGEGLWRREVAAFELDQLLGTDLVPTTVAREDLPFGVGSLQWWIDDATEDHYFTLREREEFAPWFQRLALFDVIANNADRKAGHVLFDGDRCWAIDNGLAFHVEDKLRTVIWEYASDPVPSALREPLEALRDGATGPLAALLDDDEVDAVRQRVAVLLDEGVLPLPDEERDWPPYPWPLI
jgi:hypothetical protein